MSPRFSVIMPAYNRQQYMDSAISSVLAQKFGDFELLVMDDHSPTPLTVPNDPRIRLIRADVNGGFAVGVNRALQIARGDIVAFLADDDLWSPYRLENADAAHASAAVAVCAGGIVGQRAPLQANGTAALKRRESEARFGSEMLASLNGTSVRREICPNFDPTFRAWEDVEWFIRLLGREDPPEVVEIDSQDWIWRRHDGPRHLNGTQVRVAASERLLCTYRDYYQANPAQHAYRLYRLGFMYSMLGEQMSALQFTLTSFRVVPTRHAVTLALRVVWRMIVRKKLRREDV